MLHVGGRLPVAYVHGGVLGNSIATDLMLFTLFGSSVDVPKTGARSALLSLQIQMSRADKGPAVAPIELKA